MQLRRVVITGTGIYSCIGKDVSEVTKSLYKGQSGIVFSQERKDLGFRSALTGYLDKPDLQGLIHRRYRNYMSQEAEYAYLSTIEALKQAKMEQDFLDNNEVGILFGNDSTAKAVIESADIIRTKKDTTLVGSGAIFQSMNSTVTMNLSTIFRLKGINFTISGACASGSHSIGMAYTMIRHGYQNIVICGGAQEVNAMAFGSFDGIGAFSIRESAPTQASRPFDIGRDGLVPSGGAATVILETLESALRRGAPILGEVIGYGFSSNGGHISQPNVDGPSRSLRMCLKDAEIMTKDIGYINAHATSTIIGDMNEAKAIYEVFGTEKPLLSSTKSMTGHECWMAGASEIVYSLAMMHNDFIAPNINLETPDEDSAKLNIAKTTIEKNFDIFLSNSFGFGGTNSTLIVKKYKG
jgi:3-oxoacyl-[acyl-carrier-protein] synthase-1